MESNRIQDIRCGWPEACLEYEARVPLLRRTEPDTKGRETERRKNWNDLAVTVFCLPLVP